MEPPTISKKEAKKTLSGKKKKTEVIKNVLLKPYQNYWPIISQEDNDFLNTTLHKYLPRLKYDKINIPYTEIKTVPKEERKKFRQNYVTQSPLATTDTERRSIVFGVNDVTKLLENRDASCVLIASNVQPRLLVQHIIDLAVLYSVPVVVMRDLREIFKNKCGISGAVVAFKKTIEPNSELKVIQETVSRIYENYPVPENHIHYHRRLEIDVISIVDSPKACVVSESDPEEEVKNYHLKREGTERTFEPPVQKKRPEPITFINLDSSSFSTPSPVRNKKCVGKYHPLTIKRLKGDKNRNIRKMQKFKRKQ